MCVSTEAVIDTKSWLTIQLCDEEDGTEEETTEEDPKKRSREEMHPAPGIPGQRGNRTC